jgi:phage protein D
MGPIYEHATQISLRLSGAAIPEEVMANLHSVVVDQQAHLPSMFVLRFHDPNLELLDKGPFDLTKEVEISAESQAGGNITLIKGEITALEPEFREGMIAQLVLRGYDKSHRLFRETRSRAFLNVKDSDLANEIANAAGLKPKVDTTSTVYEHVFQHNQSDLEFLRRRAWRIGYECFTMEDQLFFRKPPQGSAELTLTWGGDLISFMPRMSLAEQVDEVIVRGWDPAKKEAVVGKAVNGRLYPKTGMEQNGSGLAKPFGSGKRVIVDEPVISQAEADALAAARMDEISGAFLEAEGIAYRRPEINAGRMVKLDALGKRFSGVYLVTGATHTYTPSGLRTTFQVRGARTGLLTEQMIGFLPDKTWPGIVPAIVTNNDDPEKWGRVKVKFPWLTNDAESHWARLVAPGAGPEAGFASIPEVGDEVAVAFAYGDFSQPYVLGGVWNGTAPLPPETASASSGEQALVRTWRSRKGNRIVLFDNSEKRIEIRTTDGRTITIDDAKRQLSVKVPGVEINLKDQKLTVTSDAEITIKSGSSLKIESSGNLDIRASGQLNLKGSMVNIN